MSPPPPLRGSYLQQSPKSARQGEQEASVAGHVEHASGKTSSTKQEKSLGRLQSFNLWCTFLASSVNYLCVHTQVAVLRSQRSRTHPRARLMMLFMGTQLTLPYTLSVYLVRDFLSEAASEQLIGQLTGLLAASQSFARSLTAYPWGMLSDLVGRKVCIIVGTAASIVSLLGYGSSRSYVAAMLSRAIPALLVGSPVALKSMIGDVCDETGQAKAMAIFNLGHGMGTVVGPILGGALAYPCTNFPGFPFCSEGGVFQQRPFLLPCLAVSMLGFLALAGNIFLLDETHPKLVVLPGGWWGNLWRMLCCRQKPEEFQQDSTEGGICKQLVMQSSHSTRPSDLEMGRLLSSRSLSANGHANLLPEKESGHSLADGRQLESTPHAGKGHWEAESVPKTARTLAADAKAGDEVEGASQEGEEERSALLRPETAQINPASSAKDHSQAEYRWWKDKDVRTALVGSGMVAFLFNFADELAPLFVSAPASQGGLSLPLKEFTWPISCGGAALVVFSLALYPRLIKRFGALTLCRAGMIGGIPAAMIFPLSSVFRQVYILEQACLFMAASFKSVAKVCALNSSMILVNLVAPKATMGAVNGGAMTLQSGGRAFGPLLSGTVWAIVVSLHFSGQQFVGFALLALALAATQFLYVGLKLPGNR